MAQTVISRGFGLLQRIITRGFFSGAAASPDCIVAFQGHIQDSNGTQGAIELNCAVVGEIVNVDTGVNGTIYPERLFTGTIDGTSNGFNGAVTDKAGFNGDICNEC